MKKSKRILSVISVIFLLTAFAVPTFALQADETAFVITNPYESVDFSCVKQYKAALHTHTNASDGKLTLFESLERHADSSFDIVAVTDHGTVNYSWSRENPNIFIHGTLSLIGRSKGELEYMGENGFLSNGTVYKIIQNEEGDDILSLSDGRELLRIPYGIENNAISVNAHVNSWFADYHDNTITDYEDAVSGVEKAGGVCVINHVGEYTKARYEIKSENAYDVKNAAYGYYINKFARLIDFYDCCIGIDINSKGDDRTRYDRILWDELLKRFSANGDNVYAIASSDAHKLNVIDTGFTYILMNEKTSAQARNAIENGLMFPASHCIGNYDELKEIADSLKEFYGETELYRDVFETALAIKEKVEKIEGKEEKANSTIDTVYSVLDDNGVCKALTQPMITDIETCGDSIRIETENAAIVRFISNGKTFCTKKSDDAKISLSDYADSIGDYVRVEAFGEGGIVYTEAFLINAEEKTEKISVISGEYEDYGILDFLLGVMNNLLRTVKIFMLTAF